MIVALYTLKIAETILLDYLLRYRRKVQYRFCGT